MIVALQQMVVAWIWAPHRLRMWFGELVSPLRRRNLLMFYSPRLMSPLDTLTKQYSSSQARTCMISISFFLIFFICCNNVIRVIIMIVTLVLFGYFWHHEQNGISFLAEFLVLLDFVTWSSNFPSMASQSVPDVCICIDIFHFSNIIWTANLQKKVWCAKSFIIN